MSKVEIEKYRNYHDYLRPKVYRVNGIINCVEICIYGYLDNSRYKSEDVPINGLQKLLRELLNDGYKYFLFDMSQIHDWTSFWIFSFLRAEVRPNGDVAIYGVRKKHQEILEMIGYTKTRMNIFIEYNEAYEHCAQESKNYEEYRQENEVNKFLLISTKNILGSAGGYIFFDKGAYSDGWRYLEVAPLDISFCCNLGETSITEFHTDSNIGSGKKNTEIIMEYRKSENNPANICHNYLYNGFRDWFLPSIGELKMLYDNAYLYNKKAFSLGKVYWSSTTDDASYHFLNFLNFSNGEIGAANREFFDISIKAIRAF